MKEYLKDNNRVIVSIIIPLLLFVAGFVWKFIFIDARDVCIDEPFTIFNAQKSLREILLLPTQNEPNPPLFMFILSLWIRITGISAASVRLVPLFFNALTPVFLYLAGRKLSNTWGGVAAAGLFILSSYQFYFGMETRTYSLQLCATAAALYYMYSLIIDPARKGHFAGLIIANIILVYSHYFGWFVVFMEAVTCIFYFRRKAAVKKVLLAVLAAAVAFLPMAITVVRQFMISKEQTWVKPPEGSVYRRELIMFMNNPLVIQVVAVVLTAGIVIFLLGKRKKQMPWHYLTLFMFWFLPYTFMFLVSYKVPMFENRYVMYNSIGMYLTIGVLTGFLYAHLRYFLPIAVVTVLIAMGIKMQTSLEFIAYRETRKAVEYVKRNKDSSTLVIIHPYWNDFEFSYYFDRDIFRDVPNMQQRLRDSMVYQVWGLDDAKIYLDRYDADKVLFFRGGSGFDDINNYLDSLYIRKDSTFFPDCYYIFSYEKE